MKEKDVMKIDGEAIVRLQDVAAERRRDVREIIVHCSATPQGRRVTVADIDRAHRLRGFNGIGYHYLVGLDGEVWAGRSEAVIGAHCSGHNARSVGVCYVGGVDSRMHPVDTRTEAQRRSLRKLMELLRLRYPGATVHGHREFAAKACPCFDAAAEYGCQESVRQ